MAATRSREAAPGLLATWPARVYFGDARQRDAFFAHPEYLAIKARFFAKAVAGTTIFGAYER